MPAPPAARPPRRLLAHLALSPLVVAGGLIAALAVGAHLNPTSSLFAVVATMVWAPFGPHLMLAALAVLAVGIAARRAGLRRHGALVIALGAGSALAAAVILLRLSDAATGAGARIDWGASLLIGPMDRPPPDTVEVFRQVDGTDLRMAIWRPERATAPAPVLLYIHGGGFMSGTNTEVAADLHWFAAQGWLVLSAEYRLFAPDRPTWDKAPADAACALVWAFRNAARLGGDPDRIVLLGDSAGGNLAINTGFAAARGQAAGCGPAVPVPRAIAVQYPAVDPVSIYAQGFPIPGFEPRMLIEGYVGGPPGTHPDRIAAISSARFLTQAAPPTLIILPQKDSLVTAAGTEGFIRQATAAGVALKVVRLPFANHIYNQMAAGSLGNQIGRTIRDRFLRRHAGRSPP